MNGCCQGCPCVLKATSPNILPVGLLNPGAVPLGFRLVSLGCKHWQPQRKGHHISHLSDWICSLEQTSQPWEKLVLAVEADEGGGKAGGGEAKFLGLFCVQKLRTWDLDTSCEMSFSFACDDLILYGTSSGPDSRQTSQGFS